MGIASTRRTRDSWGGPTEFTEICSSHFEPECYEVQPDLVKSFGLGCKNAELRPGAVPSFLSTEACLHTSGLQHSGNTAKDTKGRI